jgi:methionine synthase II (cobalamin-independent)
VADVALLDQQVFRLMLANSLAMVKALGQAGVTPLLFLDEPGLYALDRKNPRHLVVLQELRVLVAALQREGALVGLHCCSNTHWASVLDLGLDVVALDVQLSLDALLDERDAFLRFLATGATLSLGIVPTGPAAAYAVQELVDSVESAFRATLGERRAGEALRRVLLTPACGLALRSVEDAERIFEEVKQAQRALRDLAAADSPREVPVATPAPN